MIRFASAIASYESLFWEEPAVTRNIEVSKSLQQQFRILLATGECGEELCRILPYVPEAVQPNCAYADCIAQRQTIATLAKTFYAMLARHRIAHSRIFV